MGRYSPYNDWYSNVDVGYRYLQHGSCHRMDEG
jgi:hypothetical protein